MAQYKYKFEQLSAPFQEVFEAPLSEPVFNVLSDAQLSFSSLWEADKCHLRIDELKQTAHIHEIKLSADEPVGRYREIAARYTKDPRQVSALIKLGQVYREASSNDIMGVGISTDDGDNWLPKESRPFASALRMARSIVGEVTPIADDEVAEARAELDEVRIPSKEIDAIFDEDKTFSMDELNRYIDMAIAYDQHSLSQPEADLLVGVAILQVISFFERPDIVACLNMLPKNLRGEHETPEQVAIFALGAARDIENPESKRHLDDVTGIIGYELPGRGFGRAKKRREVGKQVRAQLVLAERILANRDVSVANLRLDLTSLGIMSEGAADTYSSHLLRGIDDSVSAISAEVAESDGQDQGLMLQALAIDSLKRVMVDNIRSRLFALDTNGRGRHSDEMHERIGRLSSFSLEALLTESANEQQQQLNQEVYQDVLAATAEREARYGLTNSAYKRLDPGMSVANLIRQHNIEAGDKETARLMVKFMFALAGLDSHTAGHDDVFNQLLLDIDAEYHDRRVMGTLPASITSKQTPGEYYGPQAEWLFRNSRRLRDLPGLPVAISRLLDDLEDYKLRLSGDDPVALLIDEPEIFAEPEADTEPEVEPVEPTEPELGNCLIDDEPVSEQPQPEVESEPELELPTEPIESDEPEHDPLDEILDPNFIGIAEQLDWVVFPEGVGSATIRRGMERRVDHKKVNWKRIDHLVKLVDKFGGRIYISKERRNFATSNTPYLVAEFEYEGRRIAVAECPEKGNASYIVDHDYAAGSWQEVMKLRRTVAQTVGAIQVVHPTEEDHLQRIVNGLNVELLIK